MRVVLAKIPEFEKKFGVVKDRSVEYLGIGYIASLLRENGNEVEVLSYSIKSKSFEEVVNLLLTKDFDVLGISMLYDWAVSENLKLISELRKKGFSKKIFVGGHPPSVYYEELLEERFSIDYVCIGESEYTVLELIEAISCNSGFEYIKGLSYRKDGKVCFNGYRSLIEELDDLPFPARDELFLGLKDCSDLVINISGSRGCSWGKCAFCDVQSFYRLCPGEKWRSRTVKNIVEEIESIVNTYNHNIFNFVDDDFFGPEELRESRIDEFYNEIKSRNLNIKFSFLCNVRDIQDNILEKLKEIGLGMLFLGVESGVQRTLNTFNKGVTVEQNFNAIKKTDNKEIICKCGSIFIDPYTTIDEIQENIIFWESVGRMSLYAFSRLSIFHGTPIQKKLLKENRVIKHDFVYEYNYDMFNPKVRKLNTLVEALKLHILPVMAAIKRKQEFIFRNPAVRGNKEVMNLMIRAKRLMEDSEGKDFVEFLKKSIEDIENINSSSINEKIEELFGNSIWKLEELNKELSATVQKLRA